MANYDGNIGMSYNEVTNTITEFGDTRKIIYDCVEQLRTLINGSTAYWQGSMADTTREALTTHANKCYSCGKWINEMAWTLQQYADALAEQDRSAANKMANQ